MDPSVLHQFEQFQLGTDEAAGCQLEAEDVNASSDECKRSLIGKLFGDKVANFIGLKNTLAILWSSVKAFKTRELRVNLYQFIFENEQDKQKVLHGHAWSFDSQFLVLKVWPATSKFSTVCFNIVPIWVQIWNIPHQWLSKETGFCFRNIFGKVEDVYLSDSGSKKGRHLKIRIDLHLDKLLLRGTKLKFQGEEVGSVSNVRIW